MDPQVGLIPIGQDPSSRLFEFAHPQTGEVPVRNQDSGQLKINDDTGLVFVLLPGGCCRIGSMHPDKEQPVGTPHVDPSCIPREESPPREVDLGPFFLSKYEMTQGQWIRIKGRNPSCHMPGWAKGMKAAVGESKPFTLRNPVEMVNWLDAHEILNRLDLVLPTEAQWEYAYRGDTTTVYYTGDDPNSLEGYENMADEAYGLVGLHSNVNIQDIMPWNDGYYFHAPVGSFKANPFGLHDMAGNVSEWCRDRLWTSRQIDGTFAPGNGLRTIEKIEGVNYNIEIPGHTMRGGNFLYPSWWARASRHYMGRPTWCDRIMGVRPARSIQ
jgi:formylglycine-generating enzyme required for sulfatase activity